MAVARRWSIKLECGHWMMDQGATEKDRILDSGEAECASCGPTSPSGPLKYGGLSQKQTESKQQRQRLAAEAWQEHRRSNPYRHMPDGLVVLPAQPDSFLWWCYECDGKKPARWRKGRAASMAQVESEWAEHKASPNHLERFGFVAPLTAERLALAAARVNLTRKPPPPRRREGA